MYGDNWNKYYKRTYTDSNKKALWDVPANEAIEEDFELFKDHFDKSLPVMDLGCGTGTQSLFLAEHYTNVLAVDVSSEAIGIANELHNQNKVQIKFEVLGATDTEKAIALHNELGDVNIYMRGVLHQIKESDIVKFQQVIKTLLGNRGSLYGIEVSNKIRDYFNASNEGFSKLPKRMQQVFISNLPPKGLSPENLFSYFPEHLFKVLKTGPSKLNTNLKFKNDEPIYIPAIYALLKNR